MIFCATLCLSIQQPQTLNTVHCLACSDVSKVTWFQQMMAPKPRSDNEITRNMSLIFLYFCVCVCVLPFNTHYLFFTYAFQYVWHNWNQSWKSHSECSFSIVTTLLWMSLTEWTQDSERIFLLMRTWKSHIRCQWSGYSKHWNLTSIKNLLYSKYCEGRQISMKQNPLVHLKDVVILKRHMAIDIMHLLTYSMEQGPSRKAN